jgi:hypothetical protein
MNNHLRNPMIRTTLVVGAGLTALVLAVDFGCAEPLLELLGRIPSGDKFVHFFIAGLLSLLFNLSLGGAKFRLGPAWIQWGTLAVLVVALLEECSQRYLPHRVFSWADIAANVAGIVCFGMLASALLRRSAQRHLEAELA